MEFLGVYLIRAISLSKITVLIFVVLQIIGIVCALEE